MSRTPAKLEGTPSLVWSHLRYNNYVSTTHGLHFIATPKVACTALKWWFADLHGLGTRVRAASSRESDASLVVHDALQAVAPALLASEPEDFDAALRRTDLWRFAFVRHPVARTFSAWASKVLLAEPAQAHLIVPDIDPGELRDAADVAAAFDRFVRWLAEHEAPDAWRDPHWAPQSLLLQPGRIDYTGGIWQIERLPDFTAALQQRAADGAPLPFALRRLNETPLAYARACVLPETLDVLRQIYAEDFAAFAYPVEPPQGACVDAATLHLQLRHAALIRGRNARFGRVLADLDRAQALPSALRRESAAQRRRIATLENAQRQLEAAQRTLLDERGQLHAQLAAMYASTSWRLTAPLRALRALVRPRRWLGAIVRRAYRRPAARRAYHALRRASERTLQPRAPRLHAAVFHRVKHLLIEGEPGRASPAHWQQVHAAAKPPADFLPLVSVIVPNYNHAEFLPRRLDSIYAQTYANIEVILLDDASTDGSLEILQRYRAKHPDNTRLIAAQRNSGSPFAQWRKGFDAARGELVWIAESDDESADEFLSELVPLFADPAMRLAFCQTQFVDRDGDPVWTTREYLHDILPGLWDGDFVVSAAQLVERAWMTRNIVANVSSALMRRPVTFDALLDSGWESMRACGDWMFYLQHIRGGLVGYSARLLNRYRVHAANTSVGMHRREAFYAEHASVYAFAAERYALSADALRAHRVAVHAHWDLAGADGDRERLDALYDAADREISAQPRPINVLICGFSLTSGGGEVFPIVLANGLHQLGVNVAFFNFARLPTISAVRQRLHPDIALYELEDLGRFAALVEDLNIDVVHSHHAWVDVALADLLRTSRRCAFVVTSHGMYETLSQAEQQRVVAALSERVDQFVYIAEKNLLPFGDTFVRDKHFVNIPNAIERGSPSALKRADLGIPADAFVACLVSRAIVEKGWQQAIEAVRAARSSSGLDIRLLLVGDGPECERLSRIGVPEGIHLLGFRDDVQDLFRVADVGILPTRFSGESFPLVALECLAAQRPFLASEVGELRRILQAPAGLAGVLVGLENGDIPVARWADTLRSLAEDRTKLHAMSRAVAHASEAYALHAVAGAYLQCYRHAMGLRAAGECEGVEPRVATG